MGSRKWVQLFEEGSADQRDLLGGKGANLAEMTNIGLPVPPGFTVTTDACRAFLESDQEVPAGMMNEVEDALTHLETHMDRRFGDANAPLLLSVRSGAKFSMPGMMETVLNLGLNDESVAGLANEANERFAWDAYRRLVQMFGKVVLEIDAGLFEKALTAAKTEAGIEFDHELDAEQLKVLVRTFRSIIEDSGEVFPDDPREQLAAAVLAVFRSWDTPRAKAYRRSNRIDEKLGTAVNVQAMVFGNTGSDSASGVAFTRNPNTGAEGIFGEYLVNAQGEDVVSGIRTPGHVENMNDDVAFAPAFQELKAIGERLERHYTDMQDVEFTIQDGKLWMLQTRTGKRTAPAAVKMAVDMESEGLIDRKTAVLRVQPAQLEQLLHPRVDETFEVDTIATGLPASPGAAVGAVVFEPLEAKARGEAGEAVILVRNETSADDFPGMERSQGILTARGGMTSHAAVVARGMGKPAITGCSDIVVDYENQEFVVGKTTVRAGEVITIDGSTGRVIIGEAPMVEANLSGNVDEILGWADEFRRLGVRANADLPVDAEHALEFGADGIGLCRTEHMFFAEDRIDHMRAMILAQTEDARKEELAKLAPMQTGDFEAIFTVMNGRPVTIRLLDPPLHEFLPQNEDEQQHLADRLGILLERVQEAVEMHREVNPMLGTRGVRLGILHPEISRMQARAIFTAALNCADKGVDVKPEIMIPLVGEPEELRRQRALIDAVAEEVFAERSASIPYHVGTMIEVPRAALLAADVAAHADFFSFGTNDLTQMTFGMSRDDAETFLPDYVDQGLLPEDPFQVLDERGVGRLISMATEDGRAANPNLTVGICGEHGGEPNSVAFCDRIGLDYVSCSPFRIPVARLAAAHSHLEAFDTHDR